MGLIFLGIFLLLMIVGTTSDKQTQNIELSTNKSQDSAEVASDNTTQSTVPVVETKTFTETETIPFSSTNVNDPSLEKGKTVVKTAGIDGIKTLTYEQTYTDGVAGEKVLVSEEVTADPVTQVTAVGTKTVASVKPASNCDPNYSGACVPIASDVDCAGGRGNGPAYVSGPVYVVGTDIYGLDRDGNGIGCE